MIRANARGLSWLWFVATALFVSPPLSGCSGKAEKSQAEKSPSQTPPPLPAALPAAPRNRLFQELYHLAEGSEFVPYCALKLRAKEKGQTVAQHFEGFHLIPDAVSLENPLGLPIGVAVSEGPLKLVGFNCAACHVGRIAGVSSNIIGGPSNFDIRGFYDDLIPWLTDLHGKRLGTVVGCMLRGSKIDSKRDPELDPATEAVAQELGASLESAPPSGPGSELYEQGDEAATKPESATSEEEQATAGAEAASTTLRGLPKERKRRLARNLLGKIKEQTHLLEARIKALEIVQAVGKIQPLTVPGPGRVDAFMTALNLMDPEIMDCSKAKLPMDSPVAFPHLWGVTTLKWLHWDNNTNATLQRNMGQAIGVGAVTVEHHGRVPTALRSTLIVPALLELERSLETIQPPRWPFAEGDATLIAAGQKLYKTNCAGCHEPEVDGSMPELRASNNPGTDPQRLENFRKEVAGATPIDLLKTKLAAVELGSSASASERDKNPIWRTTNRYGARSLRGVWATAPYLHNNSVPTLADLLTPLAGRPKRFRLDYSRYDSERVGFPLLNADAGGANSFELDTSRAGNGNGGHLYGTELTGEQKRSLLAYLKQL